MVGLEGVEGWEGCVGGWDEGGGGGCGRHGVVDRECGGEVEWWKEEVMSRVFDGN